MIYMFKSLNNTIKNFDDKIKQILVHGLHFSLGISILGSFVLLYYMLVRAYPDIYYIGLKTVSLSISFASAFFACALAMDRIKKDLA